MKSALVFEGFEFHTVEHGQQMWLTLPELAAVLYGKGGHQSDVPFDKGLRQLGTLYRRHADELTPSMSMLLKLQTAGGSQDVRAFSLRGAHLLGMLARTEPAKRFRRWALDVIDAHIRDQNELMPQFHAALLEYSGKAATASLCGRGLKYWRDQKPDVEGRLKSLAERMQPSLFPH
jgi:prophage antirepressor-like protein